LGTGWSTQIPPFNPVDIIDNILRKMNGEDMQPMSPWWKGYIGQILKKKGSTNFVAKGCIEKVKRHYHPFCLTQSLPTSDWTDYGEDNGVTCEEMDLRIQGIFGRDGEATQSKTALGQRVQGTPFGTFR